MISRVLGLALGLTGLPLAAQAQQALDVTMPANGVFVGAGFAWNSTHYGTQEIYGYGVSDVYALGHWVANGNAAGTAYPDLGSDSSISPAIQAGFYRSFEGTPWLWGAKFTYNQLGSSASEENVLIPQAGSYAGLVNGTFNGNYLLRQYELSVDHQFALVPFLGYSFGRGFIYGGAGPTLSRVTANMNGLIGFAQLDHFYDVSGEPTFFSSTNWVWGATAVAGVTYFFAPSWFIDVSYSYTSSSTTTNTFTSNFTTVYPTTAFSGVSGGTYSSTFTNQAVTISINYVF